LAMEYAREKRIRQQHIMEFQRAMFLAVIFFASSHSGLLTLWEYHMPINPSCQWVYGLFAENFSASAGVIDL
ncbi:MAG: hypothetical protein KHW46_06380, partial [Clostridiales bacterium]|nr:hypothetical protein [Clostridiales bacterium]